MGFEDGLRNSGPLVSRLQFIKPLFGPEAEVSATTIYPNDQEMRPLRLLLGATAVAHAHYTRILPRLPRIDDLSPIPAFIKREQSVEACAKVADLWTQQNQNASAKARVPAELAYQCLQSVPVDVDGDVQEIEELKEFLEYQTTLAWLKAGVDGQIKPLDLMGSLDSIAWKVKAGRYENDYDVQFDIRALFDSMSCYTIYCGSPYP